MTVKPESSRDPVVGRDQTDAARAIGGTEFPYAPQSVGAARRAMGDALRRMRVAQPVADDAVLILSELVSNALKHARPLSGGTIRVAWWMEDDRILRIAVSDGGKQEAGNSPPLIGGPEGADLEAVDLDEVDESAVDGRGLGIVGLLADSWGVEALAEGPADVSLHDPGAPKTVWAVLRLHARHAAPPPPPRDRHRRGRARVWSTLVALWPGGGHGRTPGTARLGGTRLGETRGGGGGETAAGAASAWVPRYPPRVVA